MQPSRRRRPAEGMTNDVSPEPTQGLLTDYFHEVLGVAHLGNRSAEARMRLLGAEAGGRMMTDLSNPMHRLPHSVRVDPNLCVRSAAVNVIVRSREGLSQRNKRG